MRNDARIAKWGNSLAVRIPLAIARQANLAEGGMVKLVLDRDGGIVLNVPLLDANVVPILFNQRHFAAIDDLNVVPIRGGLLRDGR